MADIFELFRKISKDEEKKPMPPEYILVGLGNPGRDYAKTRHNAGFIAIDYICHEKNCECRSLKFHSLVCDTFIGGHRVLLMMPQTFMNLSGDAVREASEFYNIPPEKIIVIVDDINLEPGRMRIRKSGTDGGHNGLKDIIYKLSADTFPRIRIGVGMKPQGYDLAAWVTGRISDEEFETMLPCFKATLEASEMIMNGQTEGAMGKFNGMKSD